MEVRFPLKVYNILQLNISQCEFVVKLNSLLWPCIHNIHTRSKHHYNPTHHQVKKPMDFSLVFYSNYPTHAIIFFSWFKISIMKMYIIFPRSRLFTFRRNRLFKLSKTH